MNLRWTREEGSHNRNLQCFEIHNNLLLGMYQVGLLEVEYLYIRVHLGMGALV